MSEAELRSGLFIFAYQIFMRPDYPQKIFNDKRHNFVLLMETLAMHS